MKTVEEKIADCICTAGIVAAALYFGGHALSAWMHGAFQAVTK